MLRNPKALRRTAQLVGAAVSVLGVLVFVGWAQGNESIKTTLGGSAMKADTAVGLIACGVVLLLLASRERLDRPHYAAAALATVPVALGLTTLLQYVSARTLGLDQWLFHNVVAPDAPYPGPPAAVTALCFLMWGVGALALAIPWRGRWRVPLAASLAVTSGLAGGLSLAGYSARAWLGVAIWNSGGVAIHTAAAIFALGAGLTLAVRASRALPWSIDRLTTAGFAVGIVLMLLAAGASDALTRRSLDSVARITEVHAALREIQEARASVLGLEEIGESYLRTSADKAAARVAQVRTTLRADLSEARDLIGEVPVQQHRFDQLDKLLSEWVAWAARTIATTAPESPATEAARAAEGAARTQGMRQLLTDAESDEVLELDRRETASAAQIERTFLLTPLGFLISVVVLFSGLAFLNAGMLEQRRMQRAQRESEARLSSMVKSALDAIITVDAEQRVLLFNAAAETMFGLAAAEAIGQTLDRFIPARQREVHRRQVENPPDSGKMEWSGSLGPLSGLRRDGSEFPIEVSISQSEVGDERLSTVILRDITERRRAEEALRESEEKYRQLFELNPHPLYVLDFETLAFLAVNDAALRQYGYSRDEFLTMNARDLRPADEVPALERSVAEAATKEAPWHEATGLFAHRKRDGTAVQMEIAASRIRFLGRDAWLVLALDVTEKQSLQAQLIQAQRLESVGRLAGGVAHDFNNILGVILGSAELSRFRIGEDAKLARHLDNILKAADRGADLTRQLLAFSRRQVLQPRVLDLNQVVSEFEKLLRRLIGADIELRTLLDPHLPCVRADAGQMEQVLMNLAVNARDAMPDGGLLVISTRRLVLAAEDAAAHPGLAPGLYAWLAVSDSGDGMTPEVQAQVFEPFFTTKSAVKGTGLGLATVHGIVQQSGGQVAVESEVGKGATFSIYLPAVEEAPSASPVARTEGLPRGTETVLLVEDEAILRDLAAESLSGLGYVVMTAPNGEAALASAEAFAGEIDLMVTDMIMPGIGGTELARRLAERRPKTKVLYVSGFTDDSQLLQGVIDRGLSFLGKPFTVAALAQRVREVLDRDATDRGDRQLT